ncbi:filamentous hemagglutinin N-terminal domain-containing protein [Selenomonas sp. KH1T6]|uniref:filamentous hemagglutinin N-terminal domain-containing protein n=1 Tax=Selenomonas sp. KH1T6 TaxID=3158784 RepID=UPI0008A7223F|nr:filamentous hemagglutinin family N-terminal domain-containing protein [Selenomonas ruminantium]
MNTLTNKDKLALQVSLALVAGMFSLMPVAQGAPVLKEVVTGGAKVYQTDDGAMTAVVPDANATGVSNNVINWQDFSVGSSEKVIFDAHDAAGSGYDKTNNYLNVVTGNGTSYVNGAMKGGNHVYLVNPNGIIMGENADVDVGNLYLSTKALDPNDFIGADLSQGASVLGNTSPQAEVVNMGTIQANSVYAEGTEVRFFNTKDVQYKAVSDTSDTSGVELPPLSSTSNTSTNSGVKLKGTNYVHVGYEATAKATGTAQTADANGQYYSPDGTYAASTLGYVINGSAYAFNAGVNDYDYALVRNDYELQNMNSNKKINYMLSLKGTNTDIDTIDLSEHFALNEDMEGGFTPVGDATNPFEGKFDGNFYKISDLAVVGYEYAGLFGYTKNADIRNVGIVNPKVYAGSDVATEKNGYGGAIAGLVDHTTLENVYSVADNPAYNISASGYSVTDTAGSETFIYEGQAIGGLVGKATNGTTIKNAYNATDVLNGGGIVGILNGGSSIENAYNTGNLVNLIDDSVEEGSTAVHYGIADDATGASSIKNVYNTGKYIPSHGASETTYDSDSASVGALVPTTNNGIITNGYTVETTISDGVITAATITPVGTNSAVDTTSTDGLLAKSYGFFSADESGNAKQSSDAWRIYDKHSLPLLRSFLRANGNGTIPVSFDLNLYADDSPDAEPANNTPIPYNSNEVVYNGYYIGATNVRSDTSRGITSGIKTATSGRIKNADESFAPFYSDSQNGYDIADSTISITKRNIVPPYDMTINKVYDGTPYATDEMRAAFGTSDSAVDVADYYNRTGILVETGLVKTSVGGVMTAENVSLSGSAVSSATYYTKDTDISNAANRIPANYAVNVSQAPDAENAVPVHVTWNSTAAIDTTSTANTDGDSVLDYANYDFDVSAFIDGTNTVTGYITPRPIYVQLQTAEGLDKVYDSTDNVVYKEEGWASAASNVKNVSSVAGQALGLSDYGVVCTDNAVMSVADPYYTNGTERVFNAGTGYTANYAVTFTSSNANFEKENYEIYSYTPATETTAAGSALLTTDDSGSFLMTGTGKIDQRTVYTTNAELNYQDPDTEAISAVDYRKTYDYTTAYNEANHVDFNTTGGTVSVEDAVAQTYTTGVISGDTITFSLVTEDDSSTETIENGPTFYKDNKTDTANEVADAAYVGYYVKVGGNSAGNYKFASGTAENPGEEITLDAGNNMQIFHAGGIDRRDLYLTLNQSAGIDKTYDGNANLVDSATRAYASHTDNSNIGNVTYTNSSLEKIAADGTAWNISAAYQLTGNEGAAKNVRKVDGEVVENGKNINYAVSLTGEYADNYTLHVGDSADGNEQDVNGTNPVQFTATGKIAPVTINKVTFAGVSKKYDGTSAVGEVNGATQTDNYITINGVTDANGHSVLVGEETLQDIFGDNIDANGKYTGSVITGTYGNTVAYRAGDTSQFSTTNDQNEEIAQHVNPTKGSNTDYTRYVKYEHLDTAMVNDNYELADSTQYGTGVINPLTVTSLAYGNIGSAEKVYDGTSNLIGAGTAASPTTYKVTYNANGTVESATALDATEGATLVGTLMGSNSALGVSDIPLSYTVNGDSYFAKNDETATANATDATKVVYKLTVADASGYGDYTLGAHADTTYSNVVADGSDGVAVISGSGSITPRHVFVDGETQTKTYDGGTAISANGSDVVSMSAQSGQTAVTGLLSADEDKNNSTAVYHADAGQGYGAKDANWDTNTNALFRNDDKTVRFTPSLSANGTNYVFYHDGSEVTGTFDTTGHIIEQRDLQVTFDDIAKTFDENDYVKTNGEHQVTLTTGSGSAVFAPLTGDTVTITTQNTSQFLPLDSGNAISSTYAGTHDVRYDLVVSGADYRNYRLVDGNNNVLTTGTNASGDATATGKGSGTINAASANTAAADFGAINKVYDGNTNVTYTHTATGGYDHDQVGSDDSYHVNGLTIGTYTLNADQYSILSAIYDSADVGDNRYATYTFQITDTNFTNNVDLSGLGNTDSYHYNATDHTFTLNNNNGSITAKNIYATLTDQYVNPTKAYDNNTTVLNAATKGDNGSTINQTVANSYVTIDGFRSEDTNFTVTPTYLNENVQADGNEVRYDIAVSNNYKLYTGTYDNRSEDQYLTGAGTINPREISLAATNVATKTYDTTADVKMTAADGVTVPTFTVATGVDGESFTIATSGNNAIVGTYGNYDSTDGFTANANVALNDDDTVGYKSVKYTNVLDALTPGANTLMSNYTLVSGNGGVYSADDGGTVTFATGKGQINKLGVNGITANVGSVSKVYDGTDAFTYNHTEADGYVGDQIKQVTDAESTVNNNVVLHLTSGGTLNLDYGYTINEGNNKTRFNFTDAGTGTVTYNFTVSRDVLRSFDLTGISADSDGTYSFDKTDGLGTIEAKDIKVTMSSAGTAAKPTKEYDGTTNVLNVSFDAAANNATVDQTQAKSYVTANGFVNGETYTVAAAYTDENVIRDAANEVQTGAHTVTYTVSTDSNNYRLVDADLNADASGNVSLTGIGTITPRFVTLAADAAVKTYDQNADVKLTNTGLETGDQLPNLRVATGVTGETINTAVTSGKYGNYADGTFTEDANVALDANRDADWKAVKYSGVSISAGANTDLNNYQLVDGDAVKNADGDWIFAADKEKGKITKRTITGGDADITSFSKVYDGSKSLIYDHKSYDDGGDYDDDQVDSNTAITNVSNVTLGGYGIGQDDYSVDTENTKYTDANASSAANKTITYALKVDSDVISNYNPVGFGTWNSDNSFTFTKDTNDNSITAKNIYASLTDQATSAAPTKVYNGNEYVVNNTQANPTGTTRDVSGYVSVTGLVNDASLGVQDTATITAAYENPDVAGENGSVVAYTATITNPGNYKLYTKNAQGVVVDADGDATENTNNVLKGTGTITPKEVTFRAGYTQKTYDNETSTTPVDAAHDNEYQAPAYTFAGMVNGETLTVDGRYIKGTYVKATGDNYTPDSHVEATLNNDGSVANVNFKAVQYEGLNEAFANAEGTGNLSNYVLAGAETAGGVAATSFDADSGKAIYGADREIGKILRRSLNASDIEAEWKNGAEKVYDRTADVDDHTKWFSIHTIAANTGGVEYQLAYDLGNGGAKHIKADGTEVKDVGNHYLKYDVAGLSGSTNIDFDISGLTGGEFTQVYTSIDDGVKGKITPYTIRGNVTNGNIKTYDGTDAADASYFSFNADDVQFMRDDNVLGSNASLTDLVNVGAKYTDSANASIDPYLAAANAPGNRTVTYTLTDTTSTGTGVLSNYQLEAGSYTGTGDIRQREVYVVDKGGEVVTKTYDGGTALPDGADPGSRFKLAERDDAAKTGIVEGEEDIVLNKEAITGTYTSKDVNRENGAVVNTEVKYQDFALQDSDATTGGILSNYYLTTKDSNGTATVTGEYGTTTDVNYGTENNKIVITETKGGRITPKEIAVNVVASPEKVYDRNTDVTGDYAKVGNLAARVDGNNLTVESSSDNVVTFATGISDDEVKITLDEAAYRDKNAGIGTKISDYSLNWDNGNYDLTGEGTDGGDTFTKTGNLAGTLTDNTGTINPKLVRIDSVDNAEKIYDGNDKVTSDPGFGIVADDQNMLEADGLGSNLAISGTYDNKNANINPTESVKKDKVVNYTLSWHGGDTQAQQNYTFATANGEAYDFQGTGDIRQRKVYVVDKGGEVVTKTYDGGTALPDGADPGSRFKLAERDDAAKTGIVEGEEDIVLNKEAITGTYTSKDVNRENGAVVNTEVKYQEFALQDSDATIGGILSNYYLTTKDSTGTATVTGEYGGTTDVAYGTENNKVVITEEKGGRINPKQITVNVINSPEKEYNSDIDVNGSKGDIKYASVNNLEVKIDGAVKEGGALNDGARVIATGINDDQVMIGFNGAKYTDKNVSYDDSGQVKSDKISKYDLSWNNGNYDLVGASEDTTGASGDTLTQGYDIDKKIYTGILTDYTGTINPRQVNVASVDKAVKTYDGNTNVTSNPTFTIAEDDQKLLDKDGLGSSLSIDGTYADKNANIYPSEYSEEAEGGKSVNYILSWNGGDEQERKNYKFAASDGEEYDFTGKGDILRRAVYVQDDGGKVLTKTYDGGTDLPTNANLKNRFSLETADDDTGVIDSSVKLKKGTITGSYVNKYVARDDSGKVINTAVEFQGFELEGTLDNNGFNSKDNYYLATRNDTGTAPLTKSSDGSETDVTYGTNASGGILIKEEKGGRINPKKITVNVIESPEKEYDRTKDVADAYKAVDNLAVNVDGNILDGTADDNALTVKTGINADEVKITLNDAQYKDKNASKGDKVSNYSLSWDNGNYVLAGESTDAAGVSGDTFKNKGYDADTENFTGTLTDYTGTINPRLVTVTSVDNVEKIYDGTDAVTSAPSFTITDDDKDILKKDKLYSSLDISGTYENKNANIDPDPDAEATGGKNVNFILSWNDGAEHNNYIFAANGEADYVGKGDIRRRKVYVVDNGGDIFAKTYDGGKSLPEGADLFDRFTLADKDEAAETGIIDSDVVLKNDAVKGAYVDKNVARDDSGKVINKGVKFTGFKLTDSNTENGNDAGNYYLTYKDSTGTIPLSGSSDETESIVNYETGTKGITITEAKGGRIEPKNVTISVKKSPTKVYDASELVTGSYDDDGTEVTYASASNLEAAADGANVSRSFGNTNQVTFELDYDNGNTDKFTVSIKGDPAYEDKNVSRDKDGSVLKDKITTYNLSWTNGNYNLVGETTATTPGQEQDTFTADGNEGYTEGNKKRTGVLKDYAGEITPYKLKVKGMDSSKTYDRTVNADSPEVTATFDKASTELINMDMAGSGNVQDFLGLTVKRGTYGAPTDAAKSKALKGGKATEAEIAAAENQDSAFNRTADPFQHQVSYSGIAITNGNYEIDEEFDGTGTINRAIVTAKAGSATITAGDDMPVFTGTLEGFVAGEPDVTYTVTETVTDADGNTTTVEKEVMVPYDEYYKERIYWGPDANVRNYSVGEHSVYGWYRREEVATDQDGNKVYNYYLEKDTNLDKNYTLAQEPGIFTVKPSSGGGGGSSTPAPVAPAPEPVISKPVTVTETVNPEPVVEPVILDIGYVDRPIVADGSVYKNVSKDTSNVNNYEANASIQYGSSGTGTDSSENGTIAIDRAEVVNLLGGDVASDGTMSIANTGSSQELSVESTEEGYLSVGTNGKDGSIGIEIEDEKTDFEGTIGIEMEEKEGTIGLETEDGTLLDTSFEEGLAYEEDGGTSAGNRSSRISLKSGSKDGEAEIVADDGSKVQLDNLHQDDEEKEDEEEEESEENEDREGKAAIAYSDVA